MSDLNEFYLENFAIPNRILDSKIEKGNNYFIEYKYQFNDLYDIGIYGNYQYGSTTGTPTFNQTDEFGNIIESFEGDFLLKADAYGVGITTNWYINHLLKFQDRDSKLLNRLKLAIELSGGIGFAEVISDFRAPHPFTLATSNSSFSSQDFQSQIALKLECDYLQNPLIGTVGFKMGFQFYKTKTVKDKYDEGWIALEEPINLDFSGLFGAVYIGFGK